MSREYRVQASSLHATYAAGRFVAESPQQACELARENYRRSGLGRSLKDAGAFRFYVVDRCEHEGETEE